MNLLSTFSFHLKDTRRPLSSLKHFSSFFSYERMIPVVEAAPASDPLPGSERPKHPILPPDGPPDAQSRTHFSF